MQKFTQINEGKNFVPDPSVIKKYASYIIPLYITGELKCDRKLVDEWLLMYKASEIEKNRNLVSDLEILAIKNIFATPLSQPGYSDLMRDINNKCPKLEAFLKKHFKNTFQYR
jgi:hypothetical protein